MQFKVPATSALMDRFLALTTRTTISNKATVRCLSKGIVHPVPSPVIASRRIRRTADMGNFSQ